MTETSLFEIISLDKMQIDYFCVSATVTIATGDGVSVILEAKNY